MLDRVAYNYDVRPFYDALMALFGTEPTTVRTARYGYTRRYGETTIPVKMRTTYLQCGHRSIRRVVYTYVKWPSIERRQSSLRFLNCNAYL